MFWHHASPMFRYFNPPIFMISSRFSPRFFHLFPCLLLLSLAGCAPATTSKSGMEASLTNEGTPLPDDTAVGTVSWDGQGRLDIAPPAEVLLEIRNRCQEKGYDLGYVTSISLVETMVTAAFDCRGAS